MKKNNVYMQVTTDKYQLPVAVASSPTELARLTGRPRGTILKMISMGRRGQLKTVEFLRIELEEEE